MCFYACHVHMHTLDCEWGCVRRSKATIFLPSISLCRTKDVRDEELEHIQQIQANYNLQMKWSKRVSRTGEHCAPFRLKVCEFVLRSVHWEDEKGLKKTLSNILIIHHFLCVYMEWIKFYIFFHLFHFHSLIMRLCWTSRLFLVQF